LGEGGKKKVYLAHDTLLDRDVAFALIKTEKLDEEARTRITREVQAMGRLGSHQHIVTVFDFGEHQGQPYIVAELMAGGDVEGLIEKAPEHRLPLEQTIDIAKAVCQGLEFAHSQGVSQAQRFLQAPIPYPLEYRTMIVCRCPGKMSGFNVQRFCQ